MVWLFGLCVFGAGALGGLINALIHEQRLVLPSTTRGEGARVFLPGFLGNVVIGGVAACVSWAVYGPLSGVVVIGGPEAPAIAGLTLGVLGGAVLVGIAGARWLTNESDKRLLRATAVQAALRERNPDMAGRLASATPTEALKLVQSSPMT